MPAMNTPLIAGNWKMNKTLAPARGLVSAIRAGLESPGGDSSKRRVDVLICPPAQLLFPMAKAVADSPIMLGAQNCHESASGAFTGEISVEMIKDTGATHVIIGHSERRQIFGEARERLTKKVRAAVAGGLTAIYCVGETLAERESNATTAVIDRQFGEVVGSDVPASRLVVAYEPVWAIGTGRTATPDQAQEVHAQLRRLLVRTYGPQGEAVRILYGGSVKPDNAAQLLAQKDIDGALVGGACLAAADFLAIIRAGAQRPR